MAEILLAVPGKAVSDRGQPRPIREPISRTLIRQVYRIDAIDRFGEDHDRHVRGLETPLVGEEFGVNDD